MSLLARLRRWRYLPYGEVEPGTRRCRICDGQHCARPTVEVDVPELGAGERLCVTSDRRLTPEQIAHLKHTWSMANQGCGKIMVLDAGLNLIVLRPNTATLNADYSARFGDSA
jgi:hypothetical protein